MDAAVPPRAGEEEGGGPRGPNGVTGGEARPAHARGAHVARGVDLPPETRPGVPMSAPPAPDEGAHWQRPARQPGGEKKLHRSALDRPTPVFGTAQPPRGASGLLRRAAYDVPEHLARHWMLLMLADRVDVMEDRLGPVLAGPLDRAGMGAVARRVERNPLAAVLGAVAGAWLLRQVLD